MYLGHTIPFKGRNHLIGYLANPLWSLETLAHAKAHYERACHYEVTTLLSMVCNPLYTITLMTYCTGKIRDALDLIHNCKWCPFGFGLPIWCPFGFGTWMVCVESHGPPKLEKALHVQRLPSIHLWDKDDALITLCPASPMRAPHTWQVSHDL